VDITVDAPGILGRVAAIESRIGLAARRAGRQGTDITLIAVSKTVDVAAVREVAAAGVRDLGENRVQELASKVADLEDCPQLRWHLIGQLQRNKVRRAVEASHVIHSIDSLALAQKVSDEAARLGKIVELFAQINVSAETTKSGFAPEDFLVHTDVLARLPSVRWRGLMTIAPEGADDDTLRGVFSVLRQTHRRAAESFDPSAWNALSMGMTNDFEIAIEEGATHVRVGRAIFGERPRKQVGEEA
jgi:pyridoxal phosphate enzyme (YggS family)